MLYALVVIYNKSCNESLTLKRIVSSNTKIKVIVFDNSTREFNNKVWCNKQGFSYYSFSKNVGLSKAYNYIISRLTHSKNDYIIILDDDTDLTEEYFNEARKITSVGKCEVVLPIVYTEKFIMSPCTMKLGCKPSKIININKIDKTKISAINSGMIIRLDVFDDILYDENMFLDCVDHDFMNQVRSSGKNICVMKSKIYQNYSLTSYVGIESALHRFKIQIKDLKVYYKKYHHMFIYYLYVVWIAIKLTTKYRSFKFLHQVLLSFYK